MNIEILKELLENVGIPVTAEQLEMFKTYQNELMNWNTKMNLTTVKEEDVAIKHFYDSLLGIKVFTCQSGKSMLDLGTGAGFPGIPIKILCPDLKITLVDSLNKRINFLNHMIKLLGLSNTETIHGRAEDLGRNKKYREKYDFVVSRAVAKLSTLSEYCLPFIKKDGIFIAYKGPEGEVECENSQSALEKLGGKVSNIYRFELPLNEGVRTIIEIKKERLTPHEYPRRPGIPNKKPL